MEPQRADKRVRRSIKLIKDSFYTLSKEKPLNKITVNDICNRADINRGTFYAHYENMEALFNDLEIELADLFTHIFTQYTFDKNSHAAVDALFDCVRENLELISLASRISRIGRGSKALEKVIREYTLPEWFNISRCSSQQALLLEAFVIAGGGKIVEMWIESDFTLDEGMVKDVFENVIKHGLYHFKV